MTAIYSNPAYLASLQSSLQKYEYLNEFTGNIITDFLSNPSDSIKWGKMYDAISSFKGSPEALKAPDFRVIVTVADGTVAVDTNKSNSHSSFLSGSIAVNHNSRLAIISALLGNSGSAYEIKYSTSDSYKEAYNALRMGTSSQSALGCVRVSVKAQ
jgi:hypothetical protein